MKKIIIFFLLFQNLFSQDSLPNFSVKLLNNQSSNLVSLTNEISLISFILESYFGLIISHIFSATVFKASTLSIKPIKII